uniref:NADH dehydrogenase [ubiquinone] 1 alpha subcomplex subunit 7 n=1 Tax=Plectus sambesii TaxID=2011161 RepID=A0A914X813_9BILA
MASGQKIAKATVENRHLTPFFSYIRDKLMRVHRSKKTPGPGLPTKDGVAVFNHHGRFPNSQSARDQPEPTIPGGVHHKLAANYYLGRDGRREVDPPRALFAADGAGAQYHAVSGEVLEPEKAVSKGPGANFGLPTPTPGFGVEWKRNKTEELDQCKFNKDLYLLEKYDRYSKDH